jgi:hypothetical protein
MGGAWDLQSQGRATIENTVLEKGHVVARGELRVKK